jgi:small subunit ribosomal protein S16
MLTIRFYPTGRKHRRTYRIVVAEKARHVTKKFVEILGWYNPHTKEASFEVEKIQHYVKLNIEMSDSVKSLLQKKSIIQ